MKAKVIKGIAGLLDKMGKRSIRKLEVPAGKGQTAVYRGEFLPHNKNFSPRYKNKGIGSKEPGQFYSSNLDQPESVVNMYSDMIKGVPVYRRAVTPNESFIRGAGEAAKQNYKAGEAFDPGASLFSEMKESMQFAKQGFDVPVIRDSVEQFINPSKVVSGIGPLFTKEQLPFLLERIKDPAMRKILLKLLFGRTGGLKAGGMV
jgi:hypothetical protein|tara:strand:+ start:73 stop:681 length:609 start_codon:yes stop_codon:yes gene_type:complete